ncbi:MAG: helix-turn-helix transcriptional regulator [Negativicutes bacterium]|nr:helix-turn-helix transcriptional regulator [Negativicutes bacterium]
MYGKILRRERLKQQLTQVEIGEKIGKSKQWVSELERGNIRLNVDVAVALASILDVTVDVFLPQKSKKISNIV